MVTSLNYAWRCFHDDKKIEILSQIYILFIYLFIRSEYSFLKVETRIIANKIYTSTGLISLNIDLLTDTCNCGRVKSGNCGHQVIFGHTFENSGNPDGFA